MNKSIITKKMIDFLEGNIRDIEHFLKVYGYASAIANLEGLDQETVDIVEIAAIVHDIACPLCRVKYGNVNGKNQEIESEALLIPFLEEFSLKKEMQDRIIYLVSHHHTYSDIDNVDYQILIEADYLVNAAESGYDRTNIQNFYEKYVKTVSGKRLMESIFLR